MYWRFLRNRWKSWPWGIIRIFGICTSNSFANQPIHATVKPVSYTHLTQDSASGFGLEPMQEFVADILSDRPFRTSIYDGLQATRIAQAVHDSCESGKVVYL